MLKGKSRAGALRPTHTDASKPAGTAMAARAWYVIEAFTLKNASCGGGGACPASLLNPDGARPFVYRITAVATGLKVGTRVVLKSTFVPYPKVQN